MRLSFTTEQPIVTPLPEHVVPLHRKVSYWQSDVSIHDVILHLIVAEHRRLCSGCWALVAAGACRGGADSSVAVGSVMWSQRCHPTKALHSCDAAARSRPRQLVSGTRAASVRIYQLAYIPGRDIRFQRACASVRSQGGSGSRPSVQLLRARRLGSNFIRSEILVCVDPTLALAILSSERFVFDLTRSPSSFVPGRPKPHSW